MDGKKTLKLSEIENREYRALMETEKAVEKAHDDLCYRGSIIVLLIFVAFGISVYFDASLESELLILALTAPVFIRFFILRHRLDKAKRETGKFLRNRDADRSYTIIER